MRVTIDRDGCIGCGLCESICPEVFKLDEEGKHMQVKEILMQSTKTAVWKRRKIVRSL